MIKIASHVRKAVFAFLLVSFHCNVYSQGAWDIEYIPLASVNSSLIGKEMRLDFRSNSTDTIYGEVNVLDIRRLLSRQDTVNLRIKDKSIPLRENWKLHPDQGLLKEQTLESAGGAGDTTVCIREIFLRSIDTNTLTVEVFIYTESFCKNSNPMRSEIVIPKSDIKGLLFRGR